MKILLLTILITAATSLWAQNETVAVSETAARPSAVSAIGEKLPWSPQQATGAPDTPNPGDYATAWAAERLDQREEWLQLDYMNPAALRSVRIYESHNPGAISKVTARTEDGREVELEPVKDRATQAEWTSEYRLPAGQELQARSVRITVNEPAVPGYNEIDAVGLQAQDGSLQWAITATASSFYGSAFAPVGRVGSRNSEPPGWSSAQATGEPNTPLSGDHPTAWAPSAPDQGKEWLKTTFGEPIKGTGCEIYQSSGAGAITSVDLINAAGEPLATLQPTNGIFEDRPGGIVVLHLSFDSTDRVKQLRINLDTSLVDGWNEIDAVALVDEQGKRHWAAQATASTSFGGNYDSTTADPQVLLEHAAGFVETLNSVNTRLGDHLILYGSAAYVGDAAAASRQKGAPWSPEQATAAPDTPVRGDHPSAWAPKTVGAGKEWLRLEFSEQMDLAQVRVHDSNLPGAIVAIAAVLPGGMEIPLQLEAEPTPAENQPGIVVGKCPEGAALSIRNILVTLDTQRAPNGWPEIDAVELVGRGGSRQWAARATASSSYAENLGAWVNAQPFERAKTLEEANERMDVLNRRLRALEARIQELSAMRSALPTLPSDQQAK